MEKMAEFHAEINFDSIEYSSGHVYILDNLLPYEKNWLLEKMLLLSTYICQTVLKSMLHQKWGKLCSWHYQGKLQSLCGVEAFVKNPDTVLRARKQRDSAPVRQLPIPWGRVGISPASETSLHGNAAYSPGSCKEQMLLEHCRLAVPRTDTGGMPFS